MEPQEPQVIVNQPENSKEESGLFNRLKKRKKLVIVLLLIILAWLGLYLVALFASDNETDTGDGSKIKKPEPIVNEWNVKQNDAYSFSYPDGVKVSEKGEVIRVILNSGEQDKNAEISNGAVLFFQKGEYTQQSFPAYVEQKRSELAQDDFVELLTEVSPVKISELDGYAFTYNTGMSNSVDIYLALSSSEYLRVTSSFSGDVNEVEKKVSQILDTLELN